MRKKDKIKNYSTEEKIKMLCKEYNIADINEFKAFYLQYSDLFTTEELLKRYKEQIFLTNEINY